MSRYWLKVSASKSPTRVIHWARRCLRLHCDECHRSARRSQSVTAARSATTDAPICTCCRSLRRRNDRLMTLATRFRRAKNDNDDAAQRHTVKILADPNGGLRDNELFDTPLQQKNPET